MRERLLKPIHGEFGYFYTLSRSFPGLVDDASTTCRASLVDEQLP